MSGSHRELKERRKLFNKGLWIGESLPLVAEVSQQLKQCLTKAHKKENWKSLPEGELFGSATLKASSTTDAGSCVSSVRRRKWDVFCQQFPFPSARELLAVTACRKG